MWRRCKVIELSNWPDNVLISALNSVLGKKGQLVTLSNNSAAAAWTRQSGQVLEIQETAWTWRIKGRRETGSRQTPQFLAWATEGQLLLPSERYLSEGGVQPYFEPAHLEVYKQSSCEEWYPNIRLPTDLLSTCQTPGTKNLRQRGCSPYGALGPGDRTRPVIPKELFLISWCIHMSVGTTCSHWMSN